jgi:hypothetical protein
LGFVPSTERISIQTQNTTTSYSSDPRSAIKKKPAERKSLTIIETTETTSMSLSRSLSLSLFCGMLCFQIAKMDWTRAWNTFNPFFSSQCAAGKQNSNWNQPTIFAEIAEDFALVFIKVECNFLRLLLALVVYITTIVSMRKSTYLPILLTTPHTAPHSPPVLPYRARVNQRPPTSTICRMDGIWTGKHFCVTRESGFSHTQNGGSWQVWDKVYCGPYYNKHHILYIVMDETKKFISHDCPF